MSKKKQNKLYSLPVDYIFNLIIETEDDISGAIELISHFVDSSSIKENKYVFGLACEIVSSGLGVLDLIDKEIETAILVDESEEVIIPQSVLEVLQNLVVANYYASKALRRTFYSAALH